MTVKLYLLRHGETEWSLSGQHTGCTDIPLTAHGEEEARRLASRLRGIRFSARCAARVSAPKGLVILPGSVRSHESEPDSPRWDYGDYEGLPTSEIVKKRPGWNIFADGCPNGELPDQISARADRLIQRLQALEGSVALVSHGHFSRVLAVRWIRLPTIGGQRLMLDTGTTQHPAGRPATSREPRHLPLECKLIDTLTSNWKAPCPRARSASVQTLRLPAKQRIR